MEKQCWSRIHIECIRTSFGNQDLYSYFEVLQMNSVSCHVELNISFLVLQLLFEAVRGSSWQGDIAIDDVSVANCGGS